MHPQTLFGSIYFFVVDMLYANTVHCINLLPPAHADQCPTSNLPERCLRHILCLRNTIRKLALVIKMMIYPSDKNDQAGG